MLNEALRLVRVYHDMKQSEAADKLGISRSYLSEIESNKKKPNLELVEKYATVFSMPVSSILFFSEQVGSEKPFDIARSMVAGKVLKLLKFLEERASNAGAA